MKKKRNLLWLKNLILQIVCLGKLLFHQNQTEHKRFVDQTQVKFQTNPDIEVPQLMLGDKIKRNKKVKLINIYMKKKKILIVFLTIKSIIKKKMIHI